MLSLTYLSSATTLMSPAELVALSEEIGANNAALGVTGTLSYHDGNFLSVLEGEEAVVRATFARVAADPRHKGVIVMLEKRSERRVFSGWTMAFDAAGHRTLDRHIDRAVADARESGMVLDLLQCLRSNLLPAFA